MATAAKKAAAKKTAAKKATSAKPAAKKAAGKPRVDYYAAVEEALCFGWIDSKVKAVDDLRTSTYFTPRKPKSNWSESNHARFAKLEAAGLMTDVGRACYPGRHGQH